MPRCEVARAFRKGKKYKRKTPVCISHINAALAKKPASLIYKETKEFTAEFTER